MKTEAKIQKEILDYLAFEECWACKVITANKNGVPDILACCNGLFIGIEVKKPGGAIRTLQEYQVRRIKKAGGFAIIVDNVKSVKILIKSLKYPTITN